MYIYIHLYICPIKCKVPLVGMYPRSVCKDEENQVKFPTLLENASWSKIEQHLGISV